MTMGRAKRQHAGLRSATLAIEKTRYTHILNLRVKHLVLVNARHELLQLALVVRPSLRVLERERAQLPAKGRRLPRPIGARCALPCNTAGTPARCARHAHTRARGHVRAGLPRIVRVRPWRSPGPRARACAQPALGRQVRRRRFRDGRRAHDGVRREAGRDGRSGRRERLGRVGRHGELVGDVEARRAASAVRGAC